MATAIQSKEMSACITMMQELEKYLTARQQLSDEAVNDNEEKRALLAILDGLMKVYRVAFRDETMGHAVVGRLIKARKLLSE